MHTTLQRALPRVIAAALLSLAAASASASVVVQYIQPENFTDLPHVAWQRQQALDDLSEHFQALGKTLPAGRDLSIEILDVDMAGREQPNGLTVEPLRVMRGAGDWPAIRLRYRLSEGGTVIASGEAQLSDRTYQSRINGYSRDERWRYEKQMIDDWWRAAIAPR
jgi:hypothetical protein